MIRQHIYFSGRVQAVGFRFRAQMNATQLGLTGWVRNLFDGRVEAEVQGEIEQINRFINKMKNEQWIDITDIEVEDILVEKGEPLWKFQCSECGSVSTFYASAIKKNCSFELV